MPIKTVTLLHRRPDLSPAAFLEYWRTVHAPLVWRLPGVLRYVQCRPVALDAGDCPIDGIAEVWYEDVASMTAAIASPEYAALLADEVNFMGSSTKESLFVAVAEDEIPFAQHEVG